MLSSRLIHLIEHHSEQFNKRLLESIRRDDRLKCFAQLPDSQLLYRFEDLCRHLGKWLALDDDNIYRADMKA